MDSVDKLRDAVAKGKVASEKDMPENDERDVPTERTNCLETKTNRLDTKPTAWNRVFSSHQNPGKSTNAFVESSAHFLSRGMMNR